MRYNYVENLGGTDNGIHLSCPKCKSCEVILIVLEDGCYGIKECKKCDYKDSEINENLNGKINL
jgi:Zn ribbon nucleic-acid-binding protein